MNTSETMKVLANFYVITGIAIPTISLVILTVVPLFRPRSEIAVWVKEYQTLIVGTFMFTTPLFIALIKLVF